MFCLLEMLYLLEMLCLLEVLYLLEMLCLLEVLYLLEMLCLLEVLSRGGDSHLKQTGMLVVSLRGVNFGFWSRLGCSGQSANILSLQGLV